MLSRLKTISLSNINRILPTNNFNAISRKSATYQIDKTNPLNSSHELARNNPILPNNKGQSYQHPSIGKNICTLENCEHKKCDVLCTPLQEKTYIGHATHDGKRVDSKYISETDLEGLNRPQYAKFYEYPQPNYDTTGQHIDHNKTEILNNNPEMNTNIHMNSSRNPTQNDDNTLS